MKSVYRKVCLIAVLLLSVTVYTTSFALASESQKSGPVFIQMQNPIGVLSQKDHVDLNKITPLILLKMRHKVAQGLVCFSPYEVRCIDSVCGDPSRSFWRLYVNGDSEHYNANSALSPGDQVEWEFVSSGER